jgi:hypothetical protein
VALFGDAWTCQGDGVPEERMKLSASSKMFDRITLLALPIGVWVWASTLVLMLRGPSAAGAGWLNGKSFPAQPLAVKLDDPPLNDVESDEGILRMFTAVIVETE